MVLLAALAGTVWTVRHYFWVDLAAAPTIATGLVGVATGRPAPLARLLATRPVRGLGGFSYSLYLIHVPIVVAISRRVAPPLAAPGLPAFALTAGLGVPVCLLVAWLFARAFEIPFQRYGSRAERPVAPRSATAASPSYEAR